MSKHKLDCNCAVCRYPGQPGSPKPYRPIRRNGTCSKCGQYPADYPSSICAGCEAYAEHQAY